MKLSTLLFAALLGTVACMPTSGVSSSAQSRVLQTQAEDDDPWPNGTPVYYQYHGAWYEGTITSYSDGIYKIKWTDDGEFEYFDDLTVVDTMVQAAKSRSTTNAYSVGTTVYRYFPSEKKFHHGEIVRYQNDVYRVEWSNGIVEQYPAGAGIDALVQAAQESSSQSGNTVAGATVRPTQSQVAAATPPPTAAETAADTEADTETLPPTEDATADTDAASVSTPFKIGTDVYKYFQGTGWSWGKISWYKDGVYTITWEDNSKEKYDDVDEVAKMVKRASKQNQGDDQESDPWENGTAVFKTYAEGDFFGEVINYQKGKYTVRWSDNSIGTYSIAQTDSMVHAAYVKVEKAKAEKEAETSKTTETSKATKSAKKGDNKFTSAEIIVIALVVICVVFFAAVCIRRRRTRKEKDSLVKQTNLSSTVYQDEPDAGEPIPDVI